MSIYLHMYIYISIYTYTRVYIYIYYVCQYTDVKNSKNSVYEGKEGVSYMDMYLFICVNLYKCMDIY